MHPAFSALFRSSDRILSCRDVNARVINEFPKIRKGAATREAILIKGLEIVVSSGINEVTFGAIADQLDMGKSAVFSYFGSREKLLFEILDLYHTTFVIEVLWPSLRKPNGLPRLESMFMLWIERFITKPQANCLYVSGAIKYSSLPIAVQKKLQSGVSAWREKLHLCVIQSIASGPLRSDTNPMQVVSEIYAMALALHHDLHLLKEPGCILRAQRGFWRVIGNYQVTEIRLNEAGAISAVSSHLENTHE